MEGEAPSSRNVRVSSFGKYIPLVWWVPQKERALLAGVGGVFWLSTIAQALQKDASEASILAFYGLGLLYTVCVMANLGDGARNSLSHYQSQDSDSEQSRTLLQLFGIMTIMLLCNAVVLLIYLGRGVSITPLDSACIGIACATLLGLTIKYGWRNISSHPHARACLAIACKALPQLILGCLFLVQPSVSQAFTIWSLGSLTVLAALRFWPSLLAFKRQPTSKPLRGVILSETANMLSIVLMSVAWLLASWRISDTI